MDAFKKLKDEFNLDEVEEKAKESIAKADEKVEEVREGIKTQKYTLEDKEYIISELQDLIASDREVMESLKDMIVNGAGNPGIYAVYATLSKSVRENVAKLSDVEKEITDYQVTESNEEYRERVFASKERLAEKKLTTKNLQKKNMTKSLQKRIFTQKGLMMRKRSKRNNPGKHRRKCTRIMSFSQKTR